MELIDIERALQKRYRLRLYAPFVKAIQTYQLIAPNDQIAVCISGGKDSLVLAKLFQRYQRHSDIPFQVKYLSMDPGFTPSNRQTLEDNCRYLNIPVQIKLSNVFQVAMKLNDEKPCYMCSRMRRGFLYQYAQEQGCNKIALAHHFDDVIETTLINIFYTGCFKTMMPKLKSQNFSGMELIRPLVLVEEKDIIRYIQYIGITPMNCGCQVASKTLSSKREEIKDLIKSLRKINKNIPTNIFKSAENVNTNCCIGWKDKEQYIHFLDHYDSCKSDEE
ncbi:MAG: ATP-binding protein [Bacilli bacterium]